MIFPPFIVDCFHAFAENKKQIVLNVYVLSFGNAKINNLLIHSLECRENNEESKRVVDDLNNVVRAELFALFPNVRKLIIQSTYGSYSYSLSLLALLNEICRTNLDEIVITSTEWKGHCWIKSVWNSDEQMLEKEYAAKGYEIEMEYVETKRDEYNLKISK